MENNMKVNLKLNRVKEITGLTIVQIAEKMNVKSRVQVYMCIKDEGCSMKNAMKLEKATGISHQFFLYPLPTALQFLPKQD
jgi:hypothetical protein